MRISINMRTVISFLLVLFFVSTINITTSNAQVDLPDGARARLVPGFAVGNIAYNPSGSTLVTAGGGMLLWDTATDTPREDFIDEGIGYYTAIAFSRDGTTLASASGLSVQLRDATTGRLRTWDVPGTGVIDVLEHRNHVHGMAFSPDGSTLVTADGDLHVWDVATGRHIARVRSSNAVKVVYSPDGNMLASSGNYTGKVDLWRATGIPSLPIEFIRSLEGFTRDVWGVAFSPDGNMLASGGWEETEVNFLVRLWNPVTYELINTMNHGGDGYDSVRSVAFSPDSTLIASGGGNIVRLWNAITGNLISTFIGHADIRDVAFSPDGTTLASGNWEGTVLLWELAPTSATITFNPDSVPDQTFTVGTPVNLTLPIATGGTPPYTYTLSPIPAGLQFDTTTQILSGTPTTATPAAFATYTATDATGQTASLTFNITVTDAATTGITFVPSAIDDLMLTVNTSMDPVYLPLAEGGTPSYTYTLDPIPEGLSFDATVQLLSGTPTTVGTTAATYTATDAIGTSASLSFSIEVIEDGPGPGDAPLDVNGDGQVTVIDLAIVALFYGTRVPAGFSLPADVNADGIVNLSDLIAVAEGIDAAGNAGTLAADDVGVVLEAVAEQVNVIEGVAEAPAHFRTSQQAGFSGIAYRNVGAAFADVKHLATDDVRLGKWAPLLKELLQLLTEMQEIPDTTALLPNYPNPFNPETWIPYHLSKDAEVTLTIHDVSGTAVRELSLGHQPVGVYESRSRAAYWDGKNGSGEPVASGLYFYTLTAGEFTATRKLLIVK